MTRHSHDQLKTVSEDADRRSPGFRLLYNPTPQLGKEHSELAFVVERPRSAYRFDIWTRAGARSQGDAVSLETWQAVFEPQSQPVDVPAWLEQHVRAAWAGGDGTDAEVQIALERAVRRLQEQQQSPAAVAGEGVA
jgi:hypothetical protein